MPDLKYRVVVGLATCGIASGAAKVYELLHEAVQGLPVSLLRTGCIGMCYNEPLVEVITVDGKRYLYGKLAPADALRIVDQHLRQDRPVTDLLVLGEGAETGDESFFDQQHRILLKNCGHIDPEEIESYQSVGGYEGLRRVLTNMTPEEVIDEIRRSGLRGRGGAGFPTHIKWRLTREAAGEQKYIVCNADEGDPGAFMDRSILEGDTHSVLEGMLIAGYAIGADSGYIYIRAEYPLAIRRLKLAISQAEACGLLGERILGSDFSFRVSIREGAGAFVCGEETALLMSIEGKRGMPRFRPPFPAQKGLFGCPTSINNVETLANVPRILHQGAEAFSSLGTEESKGTKVFALAGKTRRGGLIEIPMGTTINKIVFGIGGGISTGKPFKAVQTGGPSGGCIPAFLGDTPVDYESLKKIGAIMGSGGLLVMDEETCMVDVAKYFLTFTKEESCGKCTFCRAGTNQMHKILERITNGEGREEDVDILVDLAEKIKAGSLCGLGQTAPNPVLTTIQYYRDEYEAHVGEKYCPAKKCKALIEYRIEPDLCTGCTLCARACPAGAISGEKKKAHFIGQSACIRCGLCINSCKFNAILVSSNPKVKA